MKASDKVKVKNISNRKINLASGIIEPDKTGTATIAELQCHGKIIEKVVAAPKATSVKEK